MPGADALASSGARKIPRFRSREQEPDDLSGHCGGRGFWIRPLQSFAEDRFRIPCPGTRGEGGLDHAGQVGDVLPQRLADPRCRSAVCAHADRSHGALMQRPLLPALPFRAANTIRLSCGAAGYRLPAARFWFLFHRAELRLGYRSWRCRCRVLCAHALALDLRGVGDRLLCIRHWRLSGDHFADARLVRVLSGRSDHRRSPRRRGVVVSSHWDVLCGDAPGVRVL